MEIRTLRPSELEQAWELDRVSFHVPEERRARFVEWQDPDRLVGAFEQGRLLALCGVHDFGQFFGGRAVPMGGLGSVSVAADRRGAGLAGAVVRPCLEAMRERGEVISSLLPAMTRLYRGLGWEVSGSLVWRSIEPRLLQGLARPASGRLRPAAADDFEALRACYRRLASGVNGLLDRSERWWELLRRFVLPQREVFLAEDAAGEVAGYLVYRQLDGEHSALGGPFRLACDEVVWTTRDAGLALWRLLGSWASQVERILFRGGAEEALLLLLPEQQAATLAELRWMTRVIDAPGAVEARGFPAGLDAELALELSDPELGHNQGRWVLTVQRGRGRLERGGPGGLRLDVGAFASLYTGWATTATLARCGRLSGGSPDERAALDAVFAGPTPWLLDEF